MAPSSAANLAPSIEEAYRRKCIELKQRTADVEESNDAARLRIERLNRQAEKMRIERAFLLEQLAKRISPNVEDSEGSPSPPPTPKDKPLRTKRGHRKPSVIQELEGNAGSTLDSQAGGSGHVESPASDFHANGDSQRANGVSSSSREPPKKPPSPFDLYCKEVRPGLEAKAKEQRKDDNDRDRDATLSADKGSAGDPLDIDGVLARRWQALPEAEKQEFQAQHDKDTARFKRDLDAYEKKKNAREDSASTKIERGESSRAAAADEDMEMTEAEAGATPVPGAGDDKN